jgi:hypothetical protein
VLAYVPFYFDGTYPGGGARFYAEALPLEHVLVAWALERLRLVALGPPVALAGFALHAGFSHAALREREGGRPMFEPQRLEQAGISSGLVFVGTDHGFNLGHAPAEHGLVVARAREDGNDWLLWERLGRPPSYRYLYDPWSEAAVPSIEPYTPARAMRVEAESQWPLLEVSGGFGHPGYPSPSCTSAKRALRLVPTDAQVLAATFELLAPAPGRYRVRSGWIGPGAGMVRLQVSGADWEVRTSGQGCSDGLGPSVALGRDAVRLGVSTAGEIWLDWLELQPE